VERDAGQPGLLRRATAVSILPANLAGAIAVYLYFAYIDPLGGGPAPGSDQALVVFAGVTGTLLVVNWYLSTRWTHPIRRWQGRLLSGDDPSRVPVDIRRRVLNAALANALLSLAGWTLAGLFYLVNLVFVFETGTFEALRIFAAIVLVGGPVTSALAFLVSEFHWRREIPRFFPDGQLERSGVLRLPIRMRLAATFLLTSVLPLLLTLMVDLVIEWRDVAAREQMWAALLRAQLFIVAITGVASTIMAFLVARFINHPVQALRSGMAAVAEGQLDVRVPVRSTDELGEMNQHFNAMVQSLRQAARARELFGRYVSPAVARQALERGVNLGGELVHATAMFVDLRGFTALTQQLPPTAVVEVLNAYYAVVESVCDREGGVITQFLGDGVVVVFGGPLQPLPDHAHRAVMAAVGVHRGLRARKSGLALEAGIGLCTGDMIAGNIRARQRVVYTIVGDPVNQAARLQVLTRDLGASILITESTRLGLGDIGDVRLRPCGVVHLRGLGTPVLVHAVEA
jgi:adenylate cyclase